jgi:purine-nucleoside phosphorylase
MVYVPNSDAIINPGIGKRSPQLGTLAVMVATETDLSMICSLWNLSPKSFQKIFISKLYIPKQSNPDISLIGPMVGAPYATMLLENLIAWGVRKIIFLGWCGAISEKVKIGDIILPTSAIVDEGTSSHYISNNSLSQPTPVLIAQIQGYLQEKNIKFHHGKIWSTDAVYRETRDKVQYFQKQDVLAVDMETSALFSVAKFRNVGIGAILVVSDELSTMSWKQGFKSEPFRKGRQVASNSILRLCHFLKNH